jgi:DNA-binding CsgD family transcriptional regulator
MIKYTLFQKITNKDIANILVISTSTAKIYLKDIKEHYNIKIVTYFHLTQYFKLN